MKQLEFNWYQKESYYRKRKLSAANVSIIKRALRFGMARKLLAKHFGVTLGTLSHIATGFTWANVKEY